MYVRLCFFSWFTADNVTNIYKINIQAREHTHTHSYGEISLLLYCQLMCRRKQKKSVLQEDCTALHLQTEHDTLCARLTLCARAGMDSVANLSLIRYGRIIDTNTHVHITHTSA